VVAVPDLDAAVDFWTKGLGMKVTRTRQDDAGLRTVFVAYGDESFQVRSFISSICASGDLLLVNGKAS